MELSPIQIANMALGRLGVRAITTFEEETNEARAVNLYYDFIRRELLRDHKWRFATKRAKLKTLNETDNKWKYIYALPDDCLFVRSINYKGDMDGSYLQEVPVYPFMTCVPYENMHGRIGCDVKDVWCCYTADVSVPSEMDPLFIEAFGWKLAGSCALALSKDSKEYTLCVQMYQDAVRRAIDASSMEYFEAERPFTSYVSDGRGLDV